MKLNDPADPSALDAVILKYQTVLLSKPDDVDAHWQLGALYAREKRYQQALTYYAKAARLSPSTVALHFQMGLLLMEMQHWVEAIRLFHNVIRLDPQHASAYFYLGTLLLMQEDFSEAEVAFQNMLSIQPEAVEAWVNLGVIALKREKEQAAIDFFARALALDNHHIVARHNLASTFLHHDRFENALTHYEVLLQEAPQEVEYLYNAGVARMALGLLDAAAEDFEIVLKQIPDHFEALVNLAAIMSRLEKPDSVALLKRAVAVRPTDPICQFMLAALSKTTSVTEGCPEYVQNLFDRYALYYDSHMRNTLQYDVPEAIARYLHQAQAVFQNAVDLGCGTGLTGNVMREQSKHLTGVDLSSKMLTEAGKKDIYDTLVEADLFSFLKETDTVYDLAVAADVVPYFGQLDDFFRALSMRMVPQGWFLFTTEISDMLPWQLQASMRFSHHPDYIHKQLVAHHFELTHETIVMGRMQNHEPIRLKLYVARREAGESGVGVRNVYC